MKNEELLGNDIVSVNQILPHRNKEFWDLYLISCANTWFPNSITMETDIKQWKDPKLITTDERLLLKRCLGFFAGTESLVSNNLFLNIFRDVQDAEARQFLSKQIFEESI